jgi:hypothetical protein
MATPPRRICDRPLWAIGFSSLPALGFEESVHAHAATDPPPVPAKTRFWSLGPLRQLIETGGNTFK